MAKKGGDRTVHSLNAPRTWHFPRKEKHYVVNIRPGPHSKREAIPLLMVLRDMLKLGETRKEIKRIVNEGNIIINGRVVKELRYPCGLSDGIWIPKLDKAYRIVLDNKGRFKPVEIDKKEVNLRIVKIENKTPVKGGKIQLNLSDGTNILVDKGDYKTKDSLLLESPSNKIKKVLTHKKGSVVLIIEGKHAGKLATLQDIKEDGKLVLKEKDSVIETPENYVLVVGDKKPEIVITYE